MYSDAALLAQASSSVHLPISNLTRPDGYACDDFLGKRCTTLNHCVFDLPIKHLDNNTRPFKRQMLAIHVNTRHMAVNHSNPSVSHDQCGTLVPAFDLANQSLSTPEFQSESSVGGEQSKGASIMEMKVDISSPNSK